MLVLPVHMLSACVCVHAGALRVFFLVINEYAESGIGLRAVGNTRQVSVFVFFFLIFFNVSLFFYLFIYFHVYLSE